MGTRAHPGETTITPIYWKPAGYSFPKSYMSIVNTYIANVAAASGSDDNVYSVDTEYSNIDYLVHAGRAIVDGADFPAGCTPDPGYKACIEYSRFTNALKAFVAANRLPADLAHLYPVFLPKEAQVGIEPDGEKSGSTFCAFHSATKTASGSPLIFAVEPYGNVCPNGQAPNGDAAADTQVDTLSHEIIEAITDPTSPQAWLDTKGTNENGDMCNGNYGPPLGSTDPAHPETTRYTQVINGGTYYTQTNFSNVSYGVSPQGGCVQSDVQANARREAPATQPALNSILIRAGDDKLVADGVATITATVFDPNGAPVGGDDVTFRSETKDGSPGQCGSLNPPPGTVAMTDVSGVVTVRYQASSGDVACDVQAIEGSTGQSDQVVIAQGPAADRSAPTIVTELPATFVPGSSRATITATVTNHSPASIPDARVGIVITGDNAGARGVLAHQVHLLFADSATQGTFVAVPLTGGTARGGEIKGFVPVPGGSLAAGKSEVIRFTVSIDPDAILSAVTGAALHVEADLDQVRQSDASSTAPGTEWHWWFGPWPWYADAVAVTAHPIALEGADRMMEVTRVWSHATPTGDRFIECIVRNVGPDAANYAVWVGGVAP